MLTKEECENALDNILCNIGVARSDYRTSGKAKEDYHTLKSLIEEHFSNPPLKFEELNKGYPIYDNDEIVCGWKFIYMIDKEYKQLLLIDEEGNVNWVNYEENRFYRKEVVQEGI